MDNPAVVALRRKEPALDPENRFQRKELEEVEEDTGAGGSSSGKDTGTGKEVEIIMSFEMTAWNTTHPMRLLDPVLLIKDLMGQMGENGARTLLML